MQTNVKDLPQQYQKVLAVLKDNSENALSSTEIERITGITRRNLSVITNDLIIKHHYSIGASRKYPIYGYYMLQNEDDLRDTLKSLNNEANSILIRHKHLLENYYSDRD